MRLSVSVVTVCIYLSVAQQYCHQPLDVSEKVERRNDVRGERPGNKYVLIETNGKHNWEEAEAECQSHGGHLASICSEAENDQVLLKLFPDNPSPRWIGYVSDSGSNSVWSDGRQCHYDKLDSRESNDIRDVGSCAYMSGDGWRSGQCSLKLSGVCRVQRDRHRLLYRQRHRERRGSGVATGWKAEGPCRCKGTEVIKRQGRHERWFQVDCEKPVTQQQSRSQIKVQKGRKTTATNATNSITCWLKGNPHGCTAYNNKARRGQETFYQELLGLVNSDICANLMNGPMPACPQTTAPILPHSCSNVANAAFFWTPSPPRGNSWTIN